MQAELLRHAESRRSSRARPTISSSRTAGSPALLLTDGRDFAAGAVVLTTGTFLRGLIHIGETKIPAGRVGEAPALGLSDDA